MHMLLEAPGLEIHLEFVALLVLLTEKYRLEVYDANGSVSFWSACSSLRYIVSVEWFRCLYWKYS